MSESTKNPLSAEKDVGAAPTSNEVIPPPDERDAPVAAQTAVDDVSSSTSVTEDDATPKKSKGAMHKIRKSLGLGKGALLDEDGNPMPQQGASTTPVAPPAPEEAPSGSDSAKKSKGAMHKIRKSLGLGKVALLDEDGNNPEEAGEKPRLDARAGPADVQTKAEAVGVEAAKAEAAKAEAAKAERLKAKAAKAEARARAEEEASHREHQENFERQSFARDLARDLHAQKSADTGRMSGSRTQPPEPTGCCAVM